MRADRSRQKAKLAEEVTKAVMASVNCGEDSVSVRIEDIRPNDWTEKVFKPDIIANWDKPLQESLATAQSNSTNTDGPAFRTSRPAYRAAGRTSVPKLQEDALMSATSLSSATISEPSSVVALQSRRTFADHDRGFIGFLIIGMALPVLPLHVHQEPRPEHLRGWPVAGSQFRGRASVSRVGGPLRR